MRLIGACILIFLLLFPDLSLYGQDTKRFLNLRWGRRIARYMKKMATGQYTIDDRILQHDKIIVATEPSWLIKEGTFDDYKYKLLSDVVVAEYDINPVTGGYRSPSALYSHLSHKIEANNLGDDRIDLPEANIMQCATTVNPYIGFLVQVSYYGDFGPQDMRQRYYEYFLTNRSRSGDLHKTLVDTLGSLARKWETDYAIAQKQRGIVLDFKHVFYSASAHEDFVNFVRKLREQLIRPEYYGKLYLKMDGMARPPPELIGDLTKYIDLFIIKAYSFEPDYGEPTAPTAVFDSLSPSSLQSILEGVRVHGVPESQMIFEIPYFATVWTHGPRREWVADQPTPLLSYNNLRRAGIADSRIQHQDSSYAFFEEEVLISGNDVEPPHLYCFEDSLTIAAKYRWLSNQGLPGVALWGLGYNTGSESLKYWEAVADRYSRPPPEIVWYGVGLVFFLMAMGFPYALLNSWEVRNITAKYTKYAWRVIGISLLFFLFFVICSNPGLRNTVGLMVGAAILAIYAFLMIIRRFLMRARRYMRYAGVKT